MRAMKCDRCGKFYEFYEGEKIFKETEKANGLMLIDMDLERKHWNRKIYDLCPECMKELEDFLENNIK